MSKREWETLIAEIKALEAERDALRSKVDALLQHCPDGECHECSKIICPHGDAMHFHHDGCPACAEHEASKEQA